MSKPTEAFEQAYDNFLAGADVDTTMLDCAEFMFNAGRESVREVEQVSEWQPIETAPKDRTILLCLGNIVGAGRFGHTMPWGITKSDGFYFDGATLPSGAKHWMPLPPPPKEAA